MILQLRVELLEVSPEISRNILVPSGMPVSDFHKVLQTTMGWTNSHPHQFSRGQTTISPFPDEEEPEEEDIPDDPGSPDYYSLTVRNLLRSEGDGILYTYDFGDSWEHEIVLEKAFAPDPGKNYPFCTGGKRACPPEDCGGPFGFAEILEALGDPGHPEHDSFIDWLGEDYDPARFDPEEVNRLLQSDDFGCPDYEE